MNVVFFLRAHPTFMSIQYIRCYNFTKRCDQFCPFPNLVCYVVIEFLISKVSSSWNLQLSHGQTAWSTLIEFGPQLTFVSWVTLSRIWNPKVEADMVQLVCKCRTCSIIGSLCSPVAQNGGSSMFDQTMTLCLPKHWESKQVADYSIGGSLYSK